MDSLAQQLRQWRLCRGLSQSELARRSGMPRPNLIDVEFGRRDCTVGTLMNLAKALEITPGTLLDQKPIQFQKMLKIDRHEREAIARFILSGTGRLKARHRELALHLLPLLRPSLEANGILRDIPKNPSVRRHRYHIELNYPRALVKEICERVRKMIPLYAGGDNE